MAKDARRKWFSVVGPMADLAPGEPMPADPEHAPRQMLIVYDGWAFGRWSCFVKSENGVITNQDVTFID